MVGYALSVGRGRLRSVIGGEGRSVCNAGLKGKRAITWARI
jgi:hypothetical protein